MSAPLESMSDEELMSIAGLSTPTANPMAGMSDEELMQMAGVAKPSDSEMYQEALGNARTGIIGDWGSNNQAGAALGGIANAMQSIPFIDEVGSAIAAVPKLTESLDAYGDEYNRNQRNQQALRQATQELNPTGTAVSQIMTGIAASAPLAGGAAPASLMQAVKSGAIAGGSVGGLYGLGEGDASKDMGDSTAARFGHAAIGGAGGAALGGALGGLGYGLVKATNPAPKADPATKYLAEQIQKVDGSDPRDLGRMLEQNAIKTDASGWTSKGPPMTIADVGGAGVQNAAELAAQSPNASMGEAINFYNTRSQEAPTRLNKLIEQHIAPLDYVEQIKANQAAMGSEAVTKGYQDAYNAVTKIRDPEINKIVDTLVRDPLGKKIWSNATTIAARDGGTFGNRDATGVITSFSTKDLDVLKKSMDDFISPVGQGDENLTKSSYRFLVDLKKQLTTRGDAINPKWAEARAEYGDPASANEAMQEGYEFLSSKDWQDKLGSYKDANPNEQKSFFSGIARKMSEMMKSEAGDNPLGKAGNDARNFVMNSKVRERLNAALGEEKASSLIGDLTTEAKMGDTANRVLSNSATARRQMADTLLNDYSKSNLEKAHPVLNYFANLELKPASWVGLSSEKLQKSANAATDKKKAELLQSLGKMLFNPNVAQNTETLANVGNYISNTQNNAAKIGALLQQGQQGTLPTAQVLRQIPRILITPEQNGDQ